MRVIPTILALLFLLFQPLASQPQSTDQELARAVAGRYARLRTLSADFTQIFRSKSTRLEEHGRLSIKKPGRMRWEYVKPETKLFVADGRSTFFYVPRDRQVYTAPVDARQESPLFFLVDQGDLLTEFTVKAETAEKPLEPGRRLLRLTPKAPTAQYEYLLLEVDPATLQIRHLAVVEPTRNRNDYILSNIRENGRLDDGLFRFRIPAGVEVIRQ